MNAKNYETFPNIKSLSFVMADGQFCCSRCANGENGSLATIDGDLAEQEKLRDQWRIIGAQFNDDETICSHCNAKIPVNNQKEIEKALRDLCDGMSAREIHQSTGLPAERCQEIKKIGETI